MMSQIPFQESPNQSMRKGPAINMIVIHATQSDSFEHSLEWMLNPKSQISCHYLIGKDGRIVQLVKDSMKAWHAGKSEWGEENDCNNFSIGIELVNLNNGKDPYPDEQIKSLAWLSGILMKYFPSIIEDRIVGHDQIAKKTDPSRNFPWVKYGSYLNKIKSQL